MKLSDLPGYQSETEGVFKDVEHFRVVAASIAQALLGKGETRKQKIAYFFDTLQVDFSVHHHHEEIFLDYLNSRIVLRAPKRSREAEKTLSSRRINYLGFMLKHIEAMKVLGMTHIFLSISPEGRAKLESRDLGS